MIGVPSNHRLAERKLIALIAENEWEIDDQGQIWRLKLRTGLKSGGSHLVSCERRRAEKQLSSGYLMVRAMREGVRIVGLAHRLVWQHLYGDIPPGLTINHDNGIKNDNRPANLELATYAYQQIHAHRIGLASQSGENNNACKLTDKEVIDIRTLYLTGIYTQAELANDFGISFQHVSKIVRGERRAHSKSDALLDGEQIREYPA